MLKWSFEREARWMLWLALPLPLLAIGTLLWSWITRLFQGRLPVAAYGHVTRGK